MDNPSLNLSTKNSLNLLTKINKNSIKQLYQINDFFSYLIIIFQFILNFNQQKIEKLPIVKEVDLIFFICFL
jgi:hypothetical protein